MASQSVSEFRVEITADSLAVLITCTLPEDPSDETNLALLAKRVQRELAGLGLTGIPDETALMTWLQAAPHEGRHIRQAAFLSGQAPVHPVDGAIEWADHFFDTGFVADETSGAIDYREHAAHRSVTEGRMLACVRPAQEGRNGVDVYGKPIRVGKAKPARLRPGANVRQDLETGAFFATASGRVRLSGPGSNADGTAGTILCVDNLYHIPGSVGLETGNVSHPGSLEIEKDVLQGAKVIAGGDVEVHQCVEAAHLEAGGHLTVHGGITGGPGHRIRVEGCVHAKFILDADIEAGGDVVVEREIVHSVIKSRGALTMPHGRLIGGEVITLHGIRVGQTGSSAAVPTLLTAGVDFRLDRQITEREATMAALEETLARISMVLKPLSLDSHALEKAMASEERGNAVRALIKKTNEIKAALEHIRGEIGDLKTQAREIPRPTIDVVTRIFPETLLSIGHERLRVPDGFPGPARVRMVDGQMELRGMTV